MIDSWEQWKDKKRLHCHSVRLTAEICDVLHKLEFSSCQFLCFDADNDPVPQLSNILKKIRGTNPTAAGYFDDG